MVIKTYAKVDIKDFEIGPVQFCSIFLVLAIFFVMFFGEAIFESTCSKRSNMKQNS